MIVYFNLLLFGGGGGRRVTLEICNYSGKAYVNPVRYNSPQGIANHSQNDR